MSLKDAREARDDARKLLRNGTDPTQKRQLDKLTRQAVAGITFGLPLELQRRGGRYTAWATRVVDQSSARTARPSP